MQRVERPRSRALRDGSRFVLIGLALAGAMTLIFIGAFRPTVTRAATATAPSRPDIAIGADAAPIPTPPPPTPPPKFESFLQPASFATSAGEVMLVPDTSPSARRPRVVTMLHGMCSRIDWGCDAVKDAIPSGYVLACPSGNRSCGDAPDWGGEGDDKARHVASAVDEALAAIDIGIDRGGSDVLMGFSRGAFVARDIAYASPGRYRALVLIGGAMVPDPERLKQSGIEKVVLAAGDLDGAQKTMRSAHAKLLASGMKTRFVSLGRVYHTLPTDTAARLRDALAWAVEEP